MYTKNQCRDIAVVGSWILSIMVVFHVHADTILAEGKTKIIRQHDTDPALVFVQSKNDITAGNTVKHDIIPGKAIWANTTTCNVFNLLQQCGIPVAFKKQCDATTFEADYCEMILYEVVIRREAHGSFLKRHPYLDKGHYFPQLIVEFFLKTTDQEWEGKAIPVDDPLTQIKDNQLNLYLPALPLHQQKPFMILDTFPLCNQRELLQEISAIAQQTFLILEKAWQLVGGRLVDLKIEFGFDQRGNLVLADVIDNDSWRVLCDGKYIDKQVYRDGADLETVAKLYANVAALTSRFSSCVNTINAQQTTYKMAGVDVAAGNRFVELIAPLTKTTSRVGVDAVLGGFSSAFDIAKTNYKDPIILSTTDGVGTKLKIAESLHDHSTIGIDLVAMCVNDLIVHGAEPILFLDYFATGSLILDDAVCVIQGIVDGCKQAGCALAGGETAEMPGMYRGGEYDLAGFAIGIAERSHLLPKLESIIPGDVIIGLASSGIHANGFSLIRHLIQLHDIDLSGPAPFLTDYKSLGQALLAPTKIYFTSLLPLIRQDYIKALAHITGGGFLENIPRVLPKHCSVELDVNCWEIPPVFAWIAQLGNVSFDEMTRTFNMGIGMIAVVDQCYASLVLDALQHSGQACYRIGTVIKTDETPHVIIRNEPF